MKKSDRSLSLSKGTIAEAVSGEACIVARWVRLCWRPVAWMVRMGCW